MYNPHGDVQGLTNANGSLTKDYDYDAFGNEIGKVDSDTNPWRYCGEYFDEETDNIYLRNRYYVPNIGRFSSMDTHWNIYNMVYGDNPKFYECPNCFEGKHIKRFIPDKNAVCQANNLYAYSMNNPCNYKDDSGFFTVGTGVEVAAALGFRINFDGQLVVDDDGNVGILYGGVVGGGLPAWGASGTTTVTNADAIYDLEGMGMEVGGSVNLVVVPLSAGVDGMIGKAKDGTTVYGATISVGAKASLPVEEHGVVTNTKVVGLNLSEKAREITKKIIKYIGESNWRKLCSAQGEVEKNYEPKKDK